MWRLFSGGTLAPGPQSYTIGIVDYISDCDKDQLPGSLTATPPDNEIVAETEDTLLARALIAGHREAASTVWQRFRPAVQITLKRLLGPGEDIADLTQDVFARFFGKVSELRNLSAMRPFLIGIAFRRAREEIRRRHVRRSLRPLIEDHFREDARGWDPESRQTATRLVALLQDLGPDGQIYALRVIEGRELAEVASTMNLSISTVRRRLGRVVKRIERVSGQSPATDWSASAASASADEASSAEDFDFSEMEMAAAG
jgi:RNA polymerase sigma-70 factor (ECF subfamily)